MPSIFDYVNAPEIAAYIEQLPTNKIPIFGQSLFPRKRQNGTDISWLKGRDGIPVAITPSNYDAKATVRERTGFSKMETEMAFFREATRIGEKDRQEINKLLNHPSSSVALPIINRIFDDVSRLVEGVDVQAEYMRMKLLQYGKFTVSNLEGTAKYTYDYSMSEDNMVDITLVWSDPETSVPVKDIVEAADDIETRTGIRPTRGVMNRTTFLNMVASQSIKKDLMIGVTGTWENFYLGEQEALTYVERKTGIKFYVYSKKIGVLDETTLVPNLDPTSFVNLMDDGIVCLFPPMTLGSTWYGTTPEESDLMNGAGTQAQVALVNGGIAITTYREPHPVNVNTVVSAVMIPSFERINNVAVLYTEGIT